MLIRNFSKVVSLSQQPRIVKTKKLEEVPKKEVPKKEIPKKQEEEVKKVINYCPIWIRKNI